MVDFERVKTASGRNPSRFKAFHKHGNGSDMPEESADTPEGSADTPKGPADTPEEPADTPEEPADTPEGSADTPKGPADTPEEPADTPENPANTPGNPATLPGNRCGVGGNAGEDAGQCGTAGAAGEWGENERSFAVGYSPDHSPALSSRARHRRERATGLSKPPSRARHLWEGWKPILQSKSVASTVQWQTEHPNCLKPRIPAWGAALSPARRVAGMVGIHR